MDLEGSRFRDSTWTRKICKLMAFRAIILGLALVVCIVRALGVLGQVGLTD